MSINLSVLAERLGLQLLGEDVSITGVAPLTSAGPGELSFIEAQKWLAYIETYSERIGAVIAPLALASRISKPLLISETPALDVARAALMMGYRTLAYTEVGIHPTAVVDPSSCIGHGVSIGPLVVIGAEVVIGDETIIYAGAIIHERSIIGARCIIHSHAVIGADGYGFQYVAGSHQRIPHFGIVRIGDDVEIGSGTTVDRARFGETTIGDGTKIDNLVQIAHNVQIGRHVLIVAQVGIAGSCVIDDGAILAGQAGIVPHVTVGKGARVAAGTGVATDVPPGKSWSGWWGQEHRHNLLEISAVRKLPAFIKKVEAFLQAYTVERQ